MSFQYVLDLVHVEGHVVLEQGREDVEREVDRVAVGEVVEDLRAERVDHAVDEVGERLGRVGLLLEALDAPVGVGDDHAVLADVGDLLDAERRNAAVGPVGVGELRQVGVGERVAGEDEEDVVVAAGEEVGDVADAARGPEQLLLAAVADRRRRAGAVAAGAASTASGNQCRLAITSSTPWSASSRDELLDDRAVADRHDRLGDLVGDRPQPRAEARRHDHRSHRRQPSGTG